MKVTGCGGKGKTMTGKEIILHYLTKQSSFTITALRREYGCSNSLVSGAASAMVRRGELTRIKKEDGNVMYYPVCGLNFVSEHADIFERCRNSPAMKRVLVVWGVLSPAELARRDSDITV